MSTLTPLEMLFEMDRGSELPLPPELRDVHGRLAFPPHPGRPYVIGNFVTSLDGVTALQVPGPHLLGDFFAEQCLDGQFVTLAPQVVGRDGSPQRPGLGAGRHFAPEHPLWERSSGVKRGGSHLFLRYSFPSTA